MSSRLHTCASSSQTSHPHQEALAGVCLSANPEDRASAIIAHQAERGSRLVPLGHAPAGSQHSPVSAMGDSEWRRGRGSGVSSWSEQAKQLG